MTQAAPGWRVAGLVAATELRRRSRDRSLLITALIAPFALAAIMGIAFHPRSGGALVKIGIVEPVLPPAAGAVVAAGLAQSALPAEISVVRLTSVDQLDAALRAGMVQAGLVVSKQGPGQVSVRAAPNAPLAGPAAAGVAASIEERARLGPPGARPPAVRFRNEARGGGQSLIGYFAPSMAVVFLFIGVGAVARSLLAERQTGTIQRLAAAPVRAGAVVAGKLAGLLAVALVGLAVLWAATSLAFGARWGAPGPVAVMCVVTAVAISGLALLVTSFARDEGQADTATLVIGMVLALLGGNFFPPGSLPPFLADLSLVTPNGWALQGFGSLAIDRAGWGAVVGPALALGVFTALCVAGSYPRLRQLLVPA